jgi:exonuclease SbcC
MRIETITLENIRSHVNSSLAFSKGFNCLVGGVGCGKSSVLYAIDFALFGDPLGRSYNYLLREGVDDAKVKLTFVHNGKKYTICRGLHKKGKSISQDLEQLKLYEEEKLIASVKGDAVAEQLKAIIGLDKDLFREIVWMRQEHLKELLDTTPRERQRRLDELFGLSDFETAWSNFANVKKEYETEKKVFETDYDVIGIEKLQNEYIKTAEEFTKIENNLQTARKEIVEKEAQLKEAQTSLQSLEQLRKQTEQMQRKEVELKTKLANLEDTLANLVEQVENQKQKLAGLRKRLQENEEKIELNKNQLAEIGLNPEQTLEELKTYIETLDEQIIEIKSENDTVRKEIQTAQHRFEEIAQKNKCPLCLQDLTIEYKKGLQERLTKENEEKQKKLTEINKNLKELDHLRTRVYTIYSTMHTLTPQIELLKMQIRENEDNLKGSLQEIEINQEEERKLRIQLEELRREISKFDTTELEKAKNLYEMLLQQYLPLKKEIENLEQRKTSIAEKIDDLKGRIERAEKKKERMERIVKILEIIEGIRDAFRSIQPKLRSEFVKILEKTIQLILDQLAGETPSLKVRIDETYTPFIQGEESYEREVSNLSGGERTLLAFAYRLGLGQLIMQTRTGHSLHLLLLDEPTESLGREDGSIDRLAEAISRIKSIEQIIAVTHSEAFAEKAEHVIHVEKEANTSRILKEN